VVITGVVGKHSCVASLEVERARVTVAGENGGARGSGVEVKPFFALEHVISATIFPFRSDDLRSDANAVPSRPLAR
jgi:hypothetical protein